MRRPARLAWLGALLILITSCSTGNPPQDPYPAPALDGTDLEGIRWNLEDHRGSVVLVSVWASWCGPCREEVPVLSATDEQYGPEELLVLGLIFRDNPDAARQFIADENPTFPSVVDADGTIAVDWGVSALPQSFLIDEDGSVVARYFGPVTQQWMDEVVLPLVES